MAYSMKIPTAPPNYEKLINDLIRSPERFQKTISAGIGPAPGRRYRHWDILRHLTPPDDLTHEEWWCAIKFARHHLYQEVPLNDKRGRSFQYAMLDLAYQMLHQIDSDARGVIGGSEPVTNRDTRNTYLFKSILEEAITSSQLEGAATTREAAKDMIQRGRPPRDRSERMILNNYEAMQLIRELKNEPLTPELLFHIQSLLTRDTLDDPTAAGRFRTEAENICVMDEVGNILHRPPPAAELERRVQEMCDFANAPDDADAWIHPVLRSIILHFWLGYDHPFVDGNGRTARALFYWSMASRGFWLCEFISISRILKNAPSKYSRAFIYTETDDNDLTYFILNQLGVIIRAIRELHEYLERKQAEIRETEAMLRKSEVLHERLNYRQLALINHALKHARIPYTIESHKTSHRVSYPTSRADLLQLVELGLLTQHKRGRAYTFVAPVDLRGRLEQLQGGIFSLGRPT